MTRRRPFLAACSGALMLLLLCAGCPMGAGKPKPRLVMVVGFDLSASFVRRSEFDDSLEFLAHYLYAHLNGLGNLTVPHSLFIGSVGGYRPNEPKTFFPIQTFRDKSISELHEKLKQLFPKDQPNPFTDYNVFFEQVAETVKSKKLMLKPISIIMISDGKPGLPGTSREKAYSTIVLAPLERLARNITIRLLYTSATVGSNWRKKVKRRRVKIWTQDAAVMVGWKDPAVLIPQRSFEQQTKFFDWIADNVDFGVRAVRVD